MKDKAFTLLLAICAAAFLWAYTQPPAEAAPAAKSLQPPILSDCPAIWTAGPRTIYRCIDEQNGNVVYPNDVGFMTFAGN